MTVVQGSWFVSQYQSTDIRKVQSECRAIDDDMRWLIALISDTGMRLAEGAGLLKEDLVGLDTGQPYVLITKHPWRNLKTASSERKIPLVGEALWAAKRIVEADGIRLCLPKV